MEAESDELATAEDTSAATKTQCRSSAPGGGVGRLGPEAEQNRTGGVLLVELNDRVAGL